MKLFLAEKLIAKNVKSCNTFFKKFIGARFLGIKKGQALLFEFKNKSLPLLVDNLFVFQTLELLFLDKNMKIIKQKQLKPFYFLLEKTPDFLIELPKCRLNENLIGKKVLLS